MSTQTLQKAFMQPDLMTGGVYRRARTPRGRKIIKPRHGQKGVWIASDAMSIPMTPIRATFRREDWRWHSRLFCLMMDRK